ncbi:MAG: S-layer homology domain-containing protein [Clostridia bacterium]|nr:S-layer homology domain-containing protein [Clostridia bacterium]
MNLVLKRLFAMIIASSIIISMFVPVYAQNSEFAAELTIAGRVYRISGLGESRYINAIIMPADVHINELSMQKLNEPTYLSFSIKNDDGFTKSFTLPSAFTDGEYKTVVYDGAETLEIYFMLGSDAFKNNLLNTKIDNGELDSVIEKYGHQYEIDSEYYESVKPSVKSAMSQKLSSGTITDFKTQYHTLLLQETFQSIEIAEDVYDVLVLVGTDFTYYNQIDEYAQQEILLKLLKNLPNTTNELKSLAEQYSKEAYQADPQPDNPGTNPLGPNAGSVAVIGPGATPGYIPSLPSSHGLADIAEHWAKDCITELYGLGIVSGSNDGNFYPENNITRAEFSKMLAGVTGIEPDTRATQKFSDVGKTSWYYGYVMSIYEYGIMTGYTEDMFGPDNNITRQEMAAAIYRFLETYGIAMNEQASFADIDTASEYAQAAIEKLSGAGILSGSDGKFRPTDNLTRAEAATVMLKIYNKLKDAVKDDSKNKLTSRVITKMTQKEARITEAEQLIPKLLKRPLRGVTRAGFISDVYDLAYHFEAKAENQYFEDLHISREETASIQAAVDAGLIEKGEKFRPDEIITGYDAICAIVSALGYKEYADLVGYMKVAGNAELLYSLSKGFQIAAPLDEETAKIILLNMLQSRMATKNSFSSDGKFELAVGEETMLERVFGISMNSGIVRETNLNSLSRVGIYKQNNVIIGDNNYKADEGDDYISYLGYDVNVYYTENNELFMIAKTDKNKTVSFPVDGAFMPENLTIQYAGDNDTGTYRHRLNEDYSFLYNSALSARNARQVVDETDDGIVEIIDNNDDGIYNIVTVKKPEYVIVDSVSKLNKQIYDKNSSENMIDVYDDEVVFSFEGRNGDIRLLDIASDEIYEVYTSEDKKLIEMKLMSTIVAGNASSLSEDRITINGEEYKTTEYFDAYYSDKFELGKEYSFTISSAGKLICYSKSGKDMQPGYIINAYIEEPFGSELSIKMFTQNNKFETYTLKGRILVDGQATKIKELNDRLKMGGGMNDQLVYYSVDDNGNIKAIDFAQVRTGAEIDAMRQENNALTEHKFDETSFLYRSTGALMYPRFNVSDSMVFIIPNDIRDEDEFRVTNNSFFSDNTSYSNIKAYNLSQSGSAEVVVVRSDIALPGFSSTQGSLAIEEIIHALNEDGEVLKKVSGWVDTKYVSYFIDDSITTYKASGEELGFGDIIRFQADGDVIKSMVCDFDANENVFARNDATNASEMNGGYKNFMYQFGEAYYVGDGYIYIGGGDDGTDFASSKLRNFAVNTTNIAIIDMEEQTVKTGKISDIKSYLNFGKGDFVLIRQRNLLTMAVYVYVR